MSAPALATQDFNVSLTCSDVSKSIRFYTEGLGFEIVHKMEDGGKIQFVQLKAGTAMIGLGQDDFAKGKDRSKGIGLRVCGSTPRRDLSTALAANAGAGGCRPQDR